MCYTISNLNIIHSSQTHAKYNEKFLNFAKSTFDLFLWKLSGSKYYSFRGTCDIYAFMITSEKKEFLEEIHLQ